MSRNSYPQTQVNYTRVRGGLDMVSPAISIAPGRPIYSLNYEALQDGGLSRIDGYERFDGSSAPSDGVYYYADGSFNTGGVLFGDSRVVFGDSEVLFGGSIVSAGDTITGATSGATGYVLNVDSTSIVFVELSGTFVEESITVDGDGAGSFSNAPSLRGAPSPYLDAVYMNQAADYYREYITRPAGSGPIRGGGELNGTVYVFRDNSTGTVGHIYKSTTSGWVNVPLFSEISFDTGLVEISDGDTIVQASTSSTATVKRVVLESGAWGVDAAGRLIITDISGEFDDSGPIYVGVELMANATSTAENITIQPGGKYETVNYNFYGGQGTYRMYGCNGIDRGFEFDGEVYVPISTGRAADVPTHIACHKKHLFLSFGSVLSVSSTGLPCQFSAITGAADIGVGFDITNIIQMPGEVLGVFCENATYQLLGSGVDDFKLDTISSDAGGLAYTSKSLVGSTMTFGDYGINKVESTDSYGNFIQSSVSRDVQPLIDIIKTKVVASSVYRDKNQYRVYGDDGSGLCLTASSERSGLSFVPVYYATGFKYPIGIYNVFNSDDGSVYICSGDGWLFQANKGTSFDGEEIESFFHLMFNHMKSPTVLKSYNRAVIDTTSDGYSEIRLFPDFSYSNPRYPQHTVFDETVYRTGGRWDINNWDTFYWDSVTVTNAVMPIRGNGENIAIVGYSKTDIDAGHRIDGVTLHYIPRRVMR